MAPNVTKNGYPSSGETRFSRQSTFARSIDSYLSDVKNKEDLKSPFYKEVLCQISHLSLQENSPQQTQKCAESLSIYVENLESNFRRERKIMRVGERLKPFLSGMLQYTSACDTMIQAAPSAAMVIYGGAKLVLQLAQSFFNCFDTVLEIMHDIGNMLLCYQRFSEAYCSSDDMLDLLVRSYKTIVSFWQRAAKLLHRKCNPRMPLNLPFLLKTLTHPAYKTFLSGLVKPLDAEWQKCRQMLDSDCRHVSFLALATEAELGKQRDEDRRLEKEREQRRLIVEWIKAGEDESKLDVQLDQEVRLEVYHEGTCTWLYDNRTFKDWLSSTTKTGVWYSAGPGAGKTILSSALIKHLEAKGLNVVYYFFSFNDPTKRKSITALRSLALQLLAQTSDIPEKIVKLYETDAASSIFSLTNPYTAAIVVQALLKQVEKVHVILDGLDECYDRPAVYKILSQLTSATTYGLVKWFYTSRIEPEFRSFVMNTGAKEIVPSPELINQDIKKYIEHYASDGSLQDCCVDHWVTASEGNFLWAHLMLSILSGKDLTCEEDIEEELAKFPKGLAGCYLRSLEQLSLRSEKQQGLARRIMTIIVAADQPLRQSELLNALAVSNGANDHSSKRVPKVSLIEDLCGHFLVFDRSSKGTHDDPVLKVAHKSVQDFFLQDPTSLGASSRVRQYFVDFPTANLELGQLCLTYLSYARYQKGVNISQLLEDTSEGDHAFLKYAATFWFWHLMRAEHTLHLFETVVRFLRSQAFWTCIAVQSKIVPHLFALFTEDEPRMWNMGVSGPRQPKLDEKISFGFPIPVWLEEYSPSGPEIVRDFHTFIKDWNSVLTSHPDRVNHCLKDLISENNFFSRNLLEPDGVRVIQLGPPITHATNGVQNLSRFRVDQDSIKVLLIESRNEETEARVDFLRLSLTSKEKRTLRPDHKITPASSQPSYCCALLGDCGEIVKSYSLDSESLGLVMYEGKKSQSFSPPIVPGNVDGTSSRDSSTPGWVVNKKSISPLGHGEAIAYHLSRSGKVKLEAADSAYGSSNSDIDTSSRLEQGEACVYNPSRTKKSAEEASDEGYDSSNSGSDAEGSDSDEEDEGDPGSDGTHCLVFIHHEKSPRWFPWNVDRKIQLQISPAFHPSEPIAVWSHAAHEVHMIDLTTGRVSSGILPEPIDVELSAANAICKELYFSPCGKRLYYFLCLVTEDKSSTTCSVSVSSFQFSHTSNAFEPLRRSCPIRQITYKFSNSAKSSSTPLILTHWSLQMLHIALPSLSCDPKVVRISLGHEHCSSDCVSGPFETLATPIFFPWSTPYRKPHLLVTKSPVLRSTNSGCRQSTETIILALDVDESQIPAQNQSEDAKAPSPPVAITWDIDEKKGWRAWNPEVDDRSQELRLCGPMWERLRGTFVDSERAFSVPIRSGLDWKKKAFVSCA